MNSASGTRTYCPVVSFDVEKTLLFSYLILFGQLKWYESALNPQFHFMKNALTWREGAKPPDVIAFQNE